MFIASLLLACALGQDTGVSTLDDRPTFEEYGPFLADNEPFGPFEIEDHAVDESVDEAAVDEAVLGLETGEESMPPGCEKHGLTHTQRHEGVKAQAIEHRIDHLDIQTAQALDLLHALKAAVLEEAAAEEAAAEEETADEPQGLDVYLALDPNLRPGMN